MGKLKHFCWHWIANIFTFSIKYCSLILLLDNINGGLLPFETKLNFLNVLLLSQSLILPWIVVVCLVSYSASGFQNTRVAKQTSVSGVSEFVTPSPSQTPFSETTPITLGVSLSTCQTIRTSYWQTPSVTYWSASTPTITPRPSSVRLEHNVTSKS